MAKYADKWKKIFPESIDNEIRPADGVDNTQAYNTDAMPQYMANDPVRFDLQNAINSQLVSNDERLKEKIDKTNVDSSAHDKNPKAHTTGIAGNAASATKLQTARTLALSGKATGSTTFDGTANANINVTAVTADTASKLSTPRTISLGGNATGSANFDGSGNITINTTVNQAAHANNADVAKTLKSKNGENNIALKYEQKDGEDKKTLHAYVDGVEVPLASQNVDTSSGGIIKKTEEFVLTFVPHYKVMYATATGSAGTRGEPLIKADGSVIASFSHYTYVDAVFSDEYKINISTKKEVENGVYLSGGLTTDFLHVHLGSVQESAKNYIKEHLDYFKEQAFIMMPEAKDATRFDIVDPYIDEDYLLQTSYNEFFPDNT